MLTSAYLMKQSRGSGGEAHARGAWGVSPQLPPVPRAEQIVRDAKRYSGILEFVLR